MIARREGEAWLEAEGMNPAQKKEWIYQQKRGIIRKIIGYEGNITVIWYPNGVKISLEGYIWGKQDYNEMLKFTSLRTL
jgi:hypothetical protein